MCLCNDPEINRELELYGKVHCGIASKEEIEEYEDIRGYLQRLL